MRYRLGGEQQRISAECFRLLRLVTEIQNDVEVIKPVLDELEVMRLSCALGMLPSVNPKDFEMDMLEAREFDEDFALFLRKEVFASGERGQTIKVVSLFGKQAQVKHELACLGCWSEKCEGGLQTSDQGIYCVKSKDDTDEQTLVVFAWLQDSQFDKLRLRDTATYVLRFLTCLGPDMICCLSVEDIAEIETAAAGLSKCDLDAWKSFSVAFHVERQKEQEDGVTCEPVAHISLSAMQSVRDTKILKGSYPAVSLVKPAPVAKRVDKRKESFNGISQFAKWVVAQAEHHNVRLDFGHGDPTALRAELLRASGSWPTEDLEKVGNLFIRSMLAENEQAKERVQVYVEEHRANLLGIIDSLFDMDVLFEASKDTAFTTLHKYLEEVRADLSIWRKVDAKTQVVVGAPLRLKNQFKDLIALYHAHQNDESMDGEGDDEVRKVLEELTIKEQKVVSREGILHRFGKAITGFVRGKDESVPDGFRALMAAPLEEMRKTWFDATEMVLMVAKSVLLERWSKEKQRSMRLACNDDREKVVARAFSELLDTWSSHKHDGLQMVVRPRSRWYNTFSSYVFFEIEEEHWQLATDQLEVLKICSNGSGVFGATSLGVHRLQPDAKLLAVFTIKNHCVVIVTTRNESSFVERVDFPFGQSRWATNRGTVTFSREFGRRATLCDFNASERIIALYAAVGNVTLYRFNEAFTALEVFKRVTLTVQTSLTLPVMDIVVMDGSMHLMDAAGSVQSVNLYNRQTSRKVSMHEASSAVYKSSIFPLASGMVLGYVTATKSKSWLGDLFEPAPLEGQIEAFSNEDYRTIPVSTPTDLVLESANVSVQCLDDLLYVGDVSAGTIQVLRLKATVRSESFRIQHSNEQGVHGRDRDSIRAEGDDTDHWLRVLYHTFEKFPVRGLIRGVDDSKATLRLRLACRGTLTNSAERSCRCLLECIMRDLRKLNKPLSGMDFTRGLAFTSSDYEDAPTGILNGLTAQSLHSFLQELITFVPIQICRAEANKLTVMTDGQASSVTGTSGQLQAVDIARSIRFGLLSPLLQSWQGRCVVITSMGKQSTGKSYLLNHLTGSSFAIAGARCTDGAWMTVRVLPRDVLLVVLDFEGLGSFERTEQEDVFLSVLNASMSMLTIFRMEMRYDKEIDDLFTKFQKGVALIKGDPTLFRGKLYMSVKDVNPNDQRGVLEEFVGKVQKLLGANKESNFVTDLYSGKLDINCSPPLGTIGYYQSLMNAQSFVEKTLCVGENSGFPSGTAFLNCLRLVLAKIAILDWTSLDEGTKQFQLSEVSSKLPGLIRTGCIIPQEYVAKEGAIAGYLKEEVLSSMNGQVLEVGVAQMCNKYPTMAEKWGILDASVGLDQLRDESIDLGFDCCSPEKETTARVHQTLLQLFKTFAGLNVGTRVHGGRLTVKHASEFDAFLSFLVRRRKARISDWAKQALGERIPEEWKAVEQQFVGRFETLFTRCQSKCAECRLGCMESAAHSGTTAHDCGGNHSCEGRCVYCETSDRTRKTPPCAKEAGHDGNCECSDGDHTCGQACCMAESPNCGKRCTEKTGHEGVHKCGVSTHACGSPCAAAKCSGTCILSVEMPHTAHKCVEVRCMEKCLMDGCGELCGAMDHFHGQTDVAVAFSVESAGEKRVEIFDAESEAPVVHMCAKEHACQAMCAEAGVCRVDVFLKLSSKVFKGARGDFQYTFQEMNGSRKKCCEVLPPGQQTHQGAHSCISSADQDDTNGDEQVHYCEARCPCCSYFCTKKFGHFGLHATSHGNMRNTYFLSDAEDIDVADRKYKAGEGGEAEMCNLYCSKMGREHVHYVDCEQGSKAACVYSDSASDQRRHCTRALEPKPEKEADEMLHEKFWETLGWEDPCASKFERELFAKCAYKCDAPEHDSKPSFCMLPAWHKPESRPVTGHDGFSYVSGHKFECSHVSNGGKLHHVFVLDCSGSMNGQSWADLLAAVQEYIYNRLADGASLDLVSVVTFDSSARIEYEAQNITTMTRTSIQYRGGGTTFSAGLRSANEVLSRANLDTYKPVVIFFSDGQPHDPLQGEEVSAHIKESYEKYGLQAFAVGFGSINLSILQRVAEKMGGSYHHVLTGNEMKTTFFSISASLSTRAGLALAKPSHECTCVICGHDLASGETTKLKPCEHELHRACMEKLVENAALDGESVRCPSCRRDVS